MDEPTDPLARQLALGLGTLFVIYQVRRFRRAAAVVPDLSEGASPGLPGWTGRGG
jgi:hypothetical protein